MSELLEKMLSNININTAYKRVCANKGTGGVDECSHDDLPKGILAKAGLVSCLDYYNERHDLKLC